MVYTNSLEIGTTLLTISIKIPETKHRRAVELFEPTRNREGDRELCEIPERFRAFIVYVGGADVCAKNKLKEGEKDGERGGGGRGSQQHPGRI